MREAVGGSMRRPSHTSHSAGPSSSREEHEHPELLRAEAVPGHAPSHRLLQAAAGHRDQASQ